MMKLRWRNEDREEQI